VVREEYRRTVADFETLRRALARQEGVPATVAHSDNGARQWISDELRGRAQDLGTVRRAQGRAWLRVLGGRALVVLWSLVAVLVLVEALTAIGAGWTASRTAGIVAAVVVAGALSVVGWAARDNGGVFAPVRGLDGRLSTSKAIAALWMVTLVYVFAFLGMRLAAASGPGERDRLLDRLADIALDQLALVAAPLLVAVAVRRIVGDKVGRRVLQKLRADQASLRDLVTDDAGRASFVDAQYVLVNLVAVGFVVVGLARDPDRLPDIPATLVALAMVSVVTYLAGKLAENDRPVILSVVRVRSRGDLDSAVRQGDDIEVRGINLAAGGSDAPDLLARVVVKFGAVHVHVPLVPTDVGFTNPSDGCVVVPVPVEVEPGRVELCVVSASGVESAPYEIQIGV
jgi:hypothetical protein